MTPEHLLPAQTFKICSTLPSGLYFKEFRNTKTFGKSKKSAFQWTCYTAIKNVTSPFKPLYTVACVLHRLILRANAVRKWYTLGLYSRISIHLTSSCSLRHVGTELMYFQLSCITKASETVKTQSNITILWLSPSAAGEVPSTVICMTSGIRLCIVTLGKYTWEAIQKQVIFNHVKNGSPLLFFLLLLKRITFMFLLLKIHILMEKEQSILAKQPSAQKTHSW